MNCPHCDREIHAHVYINALEYGYYCAWCNKDIPKPPTIPTFATYNPEPTRRTKK